MLILKLSPKRLILALHLKKSPLLKLSKSMVEASGFGYKVVCHYDQKYSKPAVIYRGENVIEKLIENCLKKSKIVKK